MMLQKVMDALKGIAFAWRDHIAWPANLAEVRELIRKGPAPYDPDRKGGGGNAAPAGAAQSGRGRGGLSGTEAVEAIPGLSKQAIKSLRAAGYASVGDVRAAGPDGLAEVPNVGPKMLAILKAL